MKITHVVGARPNFMKAAPVIRALSKRGGFDQVLIHTGQHYDFNMSRVFFGELDMPEPDINLGIGSGSHAVQTARIMMRLETAMLKQRPDLALVYGDVNSTMAAALVCAKLLIPVGHVEAGLRSFDRTMPEEINRILTDHIGDLCFTHSEQADKNLLREGMAGERIYFVGNVMIDTLVRLLPKTEAPEEGGSLPARVNKLLRKDDDPYALVTLHRPSNVDDPHMLYHMMATLEAISHDLTVIFPMHPRTQKRLEASTFAVGNPQLQLIEPLGYLDFLTLEKDASVVITDSGGIQEETTFLGVPCLTVRENTERPVTVDMGTNILIGHDMERLKQEVEKILRGDAKKGRIPPLWDGKTGERIAEVIVGWGER
ncbi:MAG: UDP-N-acetylglucosamine 2-epimerase (non-hydrolyzing) [Deltaproteobacteria bacterium]|nr:UDP-N-acetylglucosamine 2-epimerase (non-hydrolyzing) [Deltaproteobacteria bacterium]